MDDAYYFIRLVRVSSNKVEIEPLTLRVGEKGATCNGHEFAAPKDGIPSKELTDMIQIGIANAFERMLVVAKSEQP